MISSEDEDEDELEELELDEEDDEEGSSPPLSPPVVATSSGSRMSMNISAGSCVFDVLGTSRGTPFMAGAAPD